MKKEIVIHPISHQSMKRTNYIVTHKEKYITEELKALQEV